MATRHAFFALGFLWFCAPAVSGEFKSARWDPLADEVWQRMQGKSWHDYAPCVKGMENACPRKPLRQCPQRSDLVQLTVPFLDFNGARATGKLIVHKNEAEALAKAFVELFELQTFRIEQMVPIDEYGGNDEKSMLANNTSAFNCRLIARGTRLSNHSGGTAIDINPLRNPYVTIVEGKVRSVEPAGDEARRYADAEARKKLADHGHQGIILEGGPAVAAFRKQGFQWGGNWKNPDYQHFSKDGR